MAKLKVSTREIGSVRVFDLEGEPTQETLQAVAWKIQRNIRRYRIQRMILNLQMIPSLEPLGMRKLLAACIRPQRSLIFGASKPVFDVLEATYLPRNIRICASEKEIAEDFGPFLMEKDADKEMSLPNILQDGEISIGKQLERRRSKRMHVALPVRLLIRIKNSDQIIESPAIATNISEGGLFAEYLDLEVAHTIDMIGTEEVLGSMVDVTIFPSANFPEEYKLDGVIRRKEMRKKQLGLAVEFVAHH